MSDSTDDFDGVTLTYHEGDGFTDGLGVGIPGREDCDDADAMLESLAEKVAGLFKKGARIVYAGTHCGNMEAGALVTIPGSLVAPRAKGRAFKAAEEAIAAFWPEVPVRRVDRPRQRGGR